ncbi:hypothetical protein EDEG_03764 [Edhazardia aedis USNM 41457]|uniref:Uncharacterized protein n=1 Tax=Edhazardia aedis (strain USNM 41457) TaxID=1003232 RepID=J9DK17_EDHAE|nr:hypothetical protein EDEG_03764 [Edhazardia aedis USNM 41457]|eukprot:EJW01702.1 hypothetical protein EDEG_03764 [Edhazardia aedis USNM 41457]
MILLLLFTLPFLLLVLKIYYKKNKTDYAGKKVLVIGGTSGLGLSISRLLKNQKAKVTVASRYLNYFDKEFGTFRLNIPDIKSFPKNKTSFDYIFCCAGTSKPGFFKDMEPTDFSKQIELNYLGTVNSLHHYMNYNKKPFKFVMIASTMCFLSFPGYSAYTPSKHALYGFFNSVFDEMKSMNIDLFIYFVSSMQTRGFEEENKWKPSFTTDIEGKNGMHPDKAASILLDGMEKGNVICSDIFTNLMKLKIVFTSLKDLLLLPVAFVFYPIVILYIRFKFWRYNSRKKEKLY